MTNADVPLNKLAEVARLAEVIADRILEQNASGTTIPPQQFTMLVSAARMLQDNGAPWPPPVEQVLMEVAKRIEQVDAAPEDTEAASKGGDVVVHLTKFLDAAKHRKNVIE